MVRSIHRFRVGVEIRLRQGRSDPASVVTGLRIVGGMSVVPGLTQLLASRRLDGLRMGLVCNPASVDARLAHASDLVLHARA